MKKLLHLLSHFFMLNMGTVISWHDGDRIIIAFRCDECGTIHGAHEASLL